MNKFKTYLAWFAAAVGMTGALTACQDDIDAPSANAPVATLEANTTIMDLKKTFWKDDVNYIYGMEDKEDAEFVTIPAREDGSHYVIKGIVVSSDEASNVFKNLVIQDKTAAIALSINSYNLYLNYRMGQEVVVDITGMYVGKYNGLLQVGYPSWYANGKVWNASFMSPQMAQRHIELNGWPNIENVDTLTVNTFSELVTTPEGLMRYQSRLVKLCDVEFTNGGKETFSTYHSSGDNQVLTDSEGNTLNVRTSGYSTFWNKTLPTGVGDVVAILSYYGTSGWQLILNDYDGCMGFGEERPERPGTEDNPYTVDQAVAEIQAGKVAQGWVYGYIVGAVAPEVAEVKSASDVEWTANPILDNTLVIGMTPDTKDLAHCLVVDLPQGSPLQEYGNLVNHPENYQKRIDIRGLLTQVMGTYGIAENSGTVGTWKIEGVEINDGSIKNGDGSKESPYNVAQVLGGAATGTTWVKGYIVGWVDGMTLADGARFTVPATVASNVLLANTPDCKDVAQCIPVQLTGGSEVRTKVNLVDNPGNLGKLLSVNGSIEKYFGASGVKAPTDYVLEGNDAPVPPTPTETVSSIDENFDGGVIPTGWTQQQVAGDKAWYTPSFNGNYYAAMTGFKGTAPFDQWLFTPGIDLSKATNKVLTFDTQVNGYGSTTSKLEVYVLNAANATAQLGKLNPTLAVAPASGYSDWVASGNIDLSAYSGVVYVGFRYNATADANYATWCVDNVKFNVDGGNGGGETPVDPNPGPVEPTGDYKGDFNTFNNGEAKASPYGTYTNATGWTADNSIVLGGDNDPTKSSNPYFGFIGAAGTMAPTLNGKTSAPGKLTSPLLSGGIGTLTFNYGFAFADTKCKFTVNIKDANGNVVKTDTVTLDTITVKTAYDYSLTVDYSGNFTIEIVNDSYSGLDSNKDRVSIWNLTWTGK